MTFLRPSDIPGYGFFTSMLTENGFRTDSWFFTHLILRFMALPQRFSKPTVAHTRDNCRAADPQIEFKKKKRFCRHGDIKSFA